MRVTTIGSLPGTDAAPALRLLLDETPEIVALPELPDRGVGADMIGRTLGISVLGADLQPAGWRLLEHGGADQRRARSLLRQDLDMLEEQAQGYEGIVKLSVTGPWTLAACAELPRGEKVLADAGARRELGAAAAEGVRDLLIEMGRRLPAVTWWLQLDEPMLAMVVDGAVATASGYQRYRAVPVSEAAEALNAFAGLAARTAVHWCGAPLPAVLERLQVDAISVDVARVSPVHLDALSAWLEGDREVWWGAVPTHQPDVIAPVDQDVRRLLDLLRRLGLDPDLVRPRSIITPACGLALWSASPARRVITQARRVAELVDEALADR